MYKGRVVRENGNGEVRVRDSKALILLDNLNLMDWFILFTNQIDNGQTIKPQLLSTKKN